MDFWHDLPSGSNLPKEINVVIEIPKGSQNKYEFDKDLGVLKLDRVLFSPMHYPGDYGLIPQTLGEDGDPLDALVMVNFPTFPGTLITARPIGVLHMQDNGEGDDKILCVPVDDVRMESMTTVREIPSAVRAEIAHFFQVYKELEGKKVIIGGWDEVEAAHRIIQESVDRYNQKFGK